MARSDSIAAPPRSRAGSGIADRLIAALALLVVAATGVLVFLLSLRVVSPAQLSGGWAPAEQLFRIPTQLSGWSAVATVAVSVVTAVGALSLLVGRLTGSGGQVFSAGHHVVDSDDLGFVLVETAGVASIVERAVLGVGGVADCVAQIRGTGSSPVRVILHIGVQPRTAIQRAGAQARETAKQAIEQLVGLEVRDVHVKAHVMDADELGSRVA